MKGGSRASSAAAARITATNATRIALQAMRGGHPATTAQTHVSLTQQQQALQGGEDFTN
jgi:Na+-transporting NADH:ubiquinone oxidoreductase subunit NqrA